MSESTVPGKAITVMTIGMDSRKQAIFRMAFKMHNVQRYRLCEDVPGEAPDIAIIDMDCVGAQALWNDFRERYPNLPAVITTVSPGEDALAPVLAKPVRIDALFPLLRETLRTPARASEFKGAAKPAMPAVTSEKAPQPKAVVVPLQTTVKPASQPADELRTQGGTVPLDQSLPSHKSPSYVLPDVIDYFDPRGSLAAALSDIRRNRLPSAVAIAGQDAMFVLPGQDSVLLLQDMSVIRRACDAVNADVLVRSLSPGDTPPRATAQSLTALLWQVSLWSSRGRLLAGLHPDTSVRLRHWPNLTRLAAVPEAMRIAAFWVRRPVSLRLTVRMLNVPPPHIFDFLAATHAIGIAEIQGGNAMTDVVPVIPAASEVAPVQEKKDRGGLLSRLLRKVVGL